MTPTSAVLNTGRADLSRPHPDHLKKKILLLSPFAADQDKIRNVPRSGQYEFHFLRDNGSYKEFYNHAKSYIEDHGIDAVVSITDQYSMVHAALAEALPEKIKGPSLESAFLTMNKFYTHLNADPDPIYYRGIELDGDISQKINALGNLQYPLFTKPAMGTGSAGTAKVRTAGELVTALNRQKESLADESMSLIPFLRHVDPEFESKYHLSLKEIALIEEFVPGTKKLVADGYISNGEIVTFALVDNNYWEDNPGTFNSCTFPSSYPPEIRKKATEIFHDVATKLRDRGFDHQIIDVEMFIRENGQVQIMEVNGRMFGQFVDIYKNTIHNGDNFQMAIDLGLGIRPEKQTPNGKFGGNYYISTFGSGRADAYLRFELLDNIPAGVSEKFENVTVELDRIRFKPDSILASSGSEGTCLLMANIVGPDKASIDAAAAYIRSRLLKLPELSPGAGQSGRGQGLSSPKAD